MEANAYPGPAVIIAYTPCMPEHGIADDAANRQAKLAVDSRAFPLFTYDPRRGASRSPSGSRSRATRRSRRTGRRARTEPSSTSSPSPGPRAASPSTSTRRATPPPSCSRPRRTASRTGRPSRRWPASSRSAPARATGPSLPPALRAHAPIGALACDARRRLGPIARIRRSGTRQMASPPGSGAARRLLGRSGARGPARWPRRPDRALCVQSMTRTPSRFRALGSYSAQAIARRRTPSWATSGSSPNGIRR